MKKNLKKLLLVALTLVLVLSFCSCGEKESVIKIAVPNDSTNEARALQLLEAQGIITLKDTGDVLATKADIVENPYNVEFYEVEAAQIPSVLQDVTYAVINSNYAIEAGLTPFVTEGTDVSYPNVVCVREDNKDTDITKALVAAVNSKAVSDFIDSSYKGAIVNDLENPGDGYDPTVDYEALAGTTIKIGCTPVPHADILEVAKEVLAEKDITLEIIIYTDYNIPNAVVESGENYANFHAHIPFQETYNEENGAHIYPVLKVHHEPMGVYSNTYKDWSGLEK